MQVLADYLRGCCTLVLSSSPSASTAPGGEPTDLLIPLATLTAALIAAVASGLGAYLQRRSGQESAAAARQSAEAAHRSAQAAEESVALNADTAAAVGKRSDAESLFKRYQDAAHQLGHDRAAVRLAGVHALAGLGDDWEHQRQVCVDLLCAYLRLPWPANDEERRRRSDEYQVRASLIAALGRRLAPDAENSWSNCNFNFAEATLVDFQWIDVTLRGNVLFYQATFEGDCSITQADSHGNVSLARSRIRGDFGLYNFSVCSGLLNLNGISVEAGANGYLDLRSIWQNPREAPVFGKGMRVNGRLTIAVSPSPDQQGEVHLADAQINSEPAEFRLMVKRAARLDPNACLPQIYVMEIGKRPDLRRWIVDERLTEQRAALSVKIDDWSDWWRPLGGPGASPSGL